MAPQHSPPGDPGPAHPDEAGIRSIVEQYVDALKTAGAVRSPRVEQARRLLARAGYPQIRVLLIWKDSGELRGRVAH